MTILSYVKNCLTVICRTYELGFQKCIEAKLTKFLGHHLVSRWLDLCKVSKWNNTVDFLDEDLMMGCSGILRASRIAVCEGP